MSASAEWFRVENVEELRSPALLVYRERVEENLQRMLAIAGGPDRLCPHIKTHKMAPLIKRQLALGITKFKCATLREAELAASCGAPDVLLAYQPVGPNVRWFHELRRAFPETRFSAVVDDPHAALALADADPPVDLLVDLDIGQHRTGIEPGQRAMDLYELLFTTPGLRAGGLHAYDGHLHDSDVAAREAACEKAFAPVEALRAELLVNGFAVPRVVAGGSPTFAMHARRLDVECSPGTCVLWDAGYGSKLPDLPFEPAAVVLTRVVSRPSPNLLCLDLGHKAVASEMPLPRVFFPQFLGVMFPQLGGVMFPQLGGVKFPPLLNPIPVAHSEEHLVVMSTRAGEFAVGAALYGIPSHICPTVALYDEALVVENGRVSERWPIDARRRRLELESWPPCSSLMRTSISR